MENFVTRGVKFDNEESKTGREKRKETLKIFVDQCLVERNKKRKIKFCRNQNSMENFVTKIRCGIKTRKREEERNIEDIRRSTFGGKE